jgi:hypothetical protein
VVGAKLGLVDLRRGALVGVFAQVLHRKLEVISLAQRPSKVEEVAVLEEAVSLFLLAAVQRPQRPQLGRQRKAELRLGLRQRLVGRARREVRHQPFGLVLDHPQLDPLDRGGETLRV